jgi:hypothetical protein
MSSDQTPIIISGAPGSGKSYWIQQYAIKHKKQLLTCSCRKDRTLREGRQKLHIWGRRREQTVLWLEGADDLTPEAQAFLRRILETHSADVQFILECRDSGKLQEPIRSRCIIQRMVTPTQEELDTWIRSRYTSIDIPSIFEYLHPDEYSYRKIQHCIYLQIHEPSLWTHVLKSRREEQIAAEDLKANELLTYQAKGFHPGTLLQSVLNKRPELLGPYGECLELAGSAWAFLGAALASDHRMNAVS